MIVCKTSLPSCARVLTWAATGALIATLAACNKAPEATPAAPAAAAEAAASGAVTAATSTGSGAPAATPVATAASAPPVGVTTVRVQQRDWPELINTTGTVSPLSTVDVKPQATSLVAQVHVKEGQFVKAGQLLFTLDARAAEADVARVNAQLARDEAALADAQRQLKRSQDLLAQNFISQGALDTVQTNVQSLTAALAADRAALDAARLGLSYTRIAAPSAGRLGVISAFPGTSVQANVTTLASITQLDPIMVQFSLPQRHLADALAALNNGGALVTVTPPEAVGAPKANPGPAASPAAAPASGVVAAPLKPTGAVTGRLTFVDNAVDAASGSVKVKARFGNAEGKLWPGSFVNVALTVRVIPGAVVVPQAAIVQSARGTQVFVVQGDKAVPRPVQLLFAQGEEAAVSGLKSGERIVLDGRQNVRPGSTVVERPAEGGGRGGRGGAAGGGRAASGAGASASAPAAAKGNTP